jgi:hypothetical protein
MNQQVQHILELNGPKFLTKIMIKAFHEAQFGIWEESLFSGKK